MLALPKGNQDCQTDLPSTVLYNLPNAQKTGEGIRQPASQLRQSLNWQKEKMMVTMEHSIMDHIVGSPDVRETWGLEAAIRSMIFDLLALDYHGWQEKLAANGLTDGQIEKLNGFLGQWVSEFNTSGLSEQLQTLKDIDNDSAMERILSEWIRGISSADLHRLIARERFPNPLDVLCYAMAQVKQVLNGIVAFELMRREIELEPSDGWSLEEDQIEYGTELAEIGLAEDAKTWPQY